MSSVFLYLPAGAVCARYIISSNEFRRWEHAPFSACPEAECERELWWKPNDADLPDQDLSCSANRAGDELDGDIISLLGRRLRIRGGIGHDGQRRRCRAGNDELDRQQLVRDHDFNFTFDRLTPQLTSY